ASEPRTRLSDEELDRAQGLIAALQAALSPLESLSSSKPSDLGELEKRHRNVLVDLSRDQHGVALVFEGPPGSALVSAFDDLAGGLWGGQAPRGLMVELNDYPEVFQTAFGDRMVRRPEAGKGSLKS